MKKHTTPLCRACGKPISFVKTAQGANMPVETAAISAVEEKGGPLTVIDGLGRVVRAREAEPEDRNTFVAYVVHWSMCEGAARLRRERGNAPRPAEQAPPQEQAKQLKLFGG